ncbi:type II toxin-antitoxin system Phd/YefM family antitoxin [Goodfellowiella coeruleoviolacea]|uniref:type II toxin-antitoxin system Phd/YefM family antitoxin n=1 Tax=Goodfellowiella coeruleoviolacea TaxID=334858 RepID=UPI003899147E
MPLCIVWRTRAVDLNTAGRDPGAVAGWVDLDEATARLSQLLDQALAGADVVITRDGVPIVRLVPVEPSPVAVSPSAPARASGAAGRWHP